MKEDEGDTGDVGDVGDVVRQAVFQLSVVGFSFSFSFRCTVDKYRVPSVNKYYLYPVQ